MNIISTMFEAADKFLSEIQYYRVPLIGYKDKSKHNNYNVLGRLWVTSFSIPRAIIDDITYVIDGRSYDKLYAKYPPPKGF